jgi:NTE family protein
MPDEASLIRTRPRIGLALGAGVARGWAHIGVLRALKRLGIEPDIVTGTSVGALVGGCYLAGHLDTLEEWTRNLSRMKIVSYLDLRVRSGGLISGGRLMAEMNKHMGDKRIEDLPMPFAAIATDLVTGHEVWLRTGPLVESLRASFSLPGVFPPICIDQRWLVDGALVDPVPVSACRALGAEMVIAVNLNADILGKARKPGATIATAAGFDLLQVLDEEQAQETPPPSRLNALTRRVFNREYDGPSLFGVMVSSLGIITDRIGRTRLAGDPPDVQIAPRLGHVGLLEFDRAAEAVDEGAAATERAIPDIADALRVFSANLRDTARV